MSQETKNWWLRVLKDDLRLTLWLQKLQRTELSGYTEHVEYLKNNQTTERNTKILQNIANDELTHSDKLIELMGARNIEIASDAPYSDYWAAMLENTQAFEKYCCANYYGEAMAAQRFEIIHEMPETPSDIKEFIAFALPDEIFHRETLKRLAGDENISIMKTIHDTACMKLTGRIITF